MNLYMALLGAGLGMVMQVLILAVQNSVEFRRMGVATSGASLFRSIGVSVFGALFTHELMNRFASSSRPTCRRPMCTPRRGPCSGLPEGVLRGDGWCAWSAA